MSTFASSRPEHPSLLEPSLLDLIAALERATDFSERCRRQWISSARQMANWFDRPAMRLPARWNAIRGSVARLHHSGLGVTAKSLAHHKSNLRAALHWFGAEYDSPGRGIPLSAEWTNLINQIDRAIRQRLYGLCRYCSARSVAPASVDQTIFDAYWQYRSETTAERSNNATRRFVVRAWNAAAKSLKGWRLRILVQPPLRRMAQPVWDAFPQGLRRDADRYFASLAKTHHSFSGRRVAPCSPSTIATRRRELAALARMAVRLGVPIKALNSLAALLHPDIAQRVIKGYRKANGPEPTSSTVELGWKLLRMARETGSIDEAGLKRLDRIRITLEQHRRSGLTPKSVKLIRQILTKWAKVIALPHLLMQQACAATERAPIKAGVAAQFAVAIGILTAAPLRPGRLGRIELGKDLCKPAGQNKGYQLTLDDHRVRNRLDLHFIFDDSLTGLVDEYVHKFRPALLRGNDSSWLFPGEDAKPKSTMLFSQQIAVRLQKTLGLRITANQFRHAAAVIYLKRRPEDYETIRRLLGHRDISTTVRFYRGLQRQCGVSDQLTLSRKG